MKKKDGASGFGKYVWIMVYNKNLDITLPNLEQQQQ